MNPRGQLRRIASTLAVAAGCAAALLLSGCAQRAGTEPGPAAPAPAAPTAAGEAATGPAQEGQPLPDPGPSPTWAPADVPVAEATATAVVAAFARPDLDSAAWWAQLAPLLSPAAAVAHTGTDPAGIPATGVTGPAVLREPDTGYLAEVDVPTDAGTYTALLVRQDQDGPWLLERLTPPPGTGP